MIDVVIAGAGPAGSLAALVMARAGARVVLLDREAFPRDKLCGDTLNPGAVALLKSLDAFGGPLVDARPLRGMLVSGPNASVAAPYPDDRPGLAVRRRDLDAWLLDCAVRAGARFESRVTVRGPLMEESGSKRRVRGLVFCRRDGDRSDFRLPALLTIAADGRRSAVGRVLGLGTHPRAPRRWAFGTYATDIADVGDVGEMHLRRGYYVGIAPLTDELSNVCVVTGPRPDGASPMDVIRRYIHRDHTLADRFSEARFEERVRVLGPLAVDVRAAGADGLLLAGDAAGFVDPMTGDGLHLAMRSAVLAASEAHQVLAQGSFGQAAKRLARSRRRLLGRKMRFNRALRGLSGSPAALAVASRGVAFMPGLARAAVRYAGDAG